MTIRLMVAGWPHPPRTDERDLVKTFEHGQVDTLLQKPFDLDELCELLVAPRRLDFERLVGPRLTLPPARRDQLRPTDEGPQVRLNAPPGVAFWRPRLPVRLA